MKIPKETEHRLEFLEPRIAPATLYAVDTSNNLLRFDSAAPGTIQSSIPITGMVTGDDIIAIDFRPGTGELYALADGSRLYTVDLETGAVDQVGTQMPTLLNGTAFGFDFDPQADNIRVVSDTGQNLRVDPDLLTVTTDTALNGDTSTLVASAYTNNYDNAQSTSLYGLDSATDSLYLVGNPGGGSTALVGALGVNFDAVTGFDVGNASGVAYAALTSGGTTSLYTINLATGAATAAGAIGNGSTSLVGLSAAMPVVTLVNAKTATYTEGDGDIVTIKTTTGEFGTADFQLAAAASGGGTLKLINIADDGTEFAGTSLSVTVKKSPTGDGLAAIGYINANTIDLNKVSVKGDLGQIWAGDADGSTPGLKSLQVDSMGRYGDANQPVFSFLQSGIQGGMGSLTIKHDFTGGSFFVLGDVKSIKIGGSIIGATATGSGTFSVVNAGSVSIGGDVIGGSGDGSGAFSASESIGSLTVKGHVIGGSGAPGIGGAGSLTALGTITTLKIGGDIVGGSGQNSGQIFGQNGMTSAMIGGDLIGGDGANSGHVRTGPFGIVGKLQIGGDILGASGTGSGSVFVGDDLTSLIVKGSIVGGDGAQSGQVFVSTLGHTGKAQIGGDIRGGQAAVSGNLQLQGGVDSLTIGGSVLGGTADNTGVVYLTIAGAGSVQIKGNLVGGSISGTDSLSGSGKIEATRIGKLTIGGSIFAGTDNSTGALQKSGGIFVHNDIGSVSIKGSLIGSAESPAAIVARGQQGPAAGSDVALGGLTVGGNVQNALILAGYDGAAANPLTAPVNGNAQIGKVSVGKHWVASSIAAGITDTDGDGFGGLDDEVINNLLDTTISRIASIVIKGNLYGSAAAGDGFGFVAQEIGSFQIGGRKLALTPGIANDLFPLAPVTNDVTLREVIIV